MHVASTSESGGGVDPRSSGPRSSAPAGDAAPGPRSRSSGLLRAAALASADAQCPPRFRSAPSKTFTGTFRPCAAHPWTLERGSDAGPPGLVIGFAQAPASPWRARTQLSRSHSSRQLSRVGDCGDLLVCEARVARSELPGPSAHLIGRRAVSMKRWALSTKTASRSQAFPRTADTGFRTCGASRQREASWAAGSCSM